MLQANYVTSKICKHIAYVANKKGKKQANYRYFNKINSVYRGINKAVGSFIQYRYKCKGAVKKY